MAALETLLREREFENISVQDIAREAGVAVGSVYSHFKDKNAFLAELLEYWRERVEARLRESEAEDPAAAFRRMSGLRDAVQTLMQAVHAQLRENGHILRAVHTYARLHPDERGRDWETLIVRSFRPARILLDVFEDEVAVGDRDLAARMLGYFFNTIFIRAALMPSDPLKDAAGLNDDVLIAEAAAMAYAYLTTPPDS